jgi:hypothetical protein
MPFKSESQRRFLWLKHPDIAKRWAKEFPGQKNLPNHKVRIDKKKTARDGIVKGLMKGE